MKSGSKVWKHFVSASTHTLIWKESDTESIRTLDVVPTSPSAYPLGHPVYKANPSRWSGLSFSLSSAYLGIVLDSNRSLDALMILRQRHFCLECITLSVRSYHSYTFLMCYSIFVHWKMSTRSTQRFDALLCVDMPLPHRIGRFSNRLGHFSRQIEQFSNQVGHFARQIGHSFKLVEEFWNQIEYLPNHDFRNDLLTG